VAIGVVLANQIVSVEKCGYTLWIEEFYVLPEARRQSVATALLEYILGEG
jgi:GNAT superfamily N-acetyltransferase